MAFNVFKSIFSIIEGCTTKWQKSFEFNLFNIGLSFLYRKNVILFKDKFPRAFRRFLGNAQGSSKSAQLRRRDLPSCTRWVRWVTHWTMNFLILLRTVARTGERFLCPVGYEGNGDFSEPLVNDRQFCTIIIIMEPLTAMSFQLGDTIFRIDFETNFLYH